MSQPPAKRPPNEIEAKPFRDYRPEPAKGEPFMAPGGWIVLLTFLATVAFGLTYAYVGRQILEPIFRPIISSVLPTSQ